MGCWLGGFASSSSAASGSASSSSSTVGAGGIAMPGICAGGGERLVGLGREGSCSLGNDASTSAFPVRAASLLGVGTSLVSARALT